MVTYNDFKKALCELGLSAGESVMIHSSFKSLGEVEGGAQTIIDALIDTVGKKGNVIFPTLCQKDWDNIYKNWHIDAPSDVGYLTNYFRKLPEARRSNQATHSVAVIGHDRDWIVETHGNYGLRYGMFGDTPFSADSPWEKLYHMDTKVLLIGVEANVCTFRHLVEYQVADKYLKMIEGKPGAEALKSEIWHYDRFDEKGVWPSVRPHITYGIIEEAGLVNKTICGNAQLKMFSSKDFCDTAKEHLEAFDRNIYHPNSVFIEWAERASNL